MPRRAARQERSIDWLGAGVLAASTSCLLLGLVWGSHDHPWLSAQVVGVLAASVFLAAAFAGVERRVREPILPFALVREKTIAASLISIAFVGMAMFGAVSFVPLFVQGVIGTSATSSGVVLTPLMLGAVVAGFLSGQWISHSGRVRPNALVGPIVLTTGMVLLWRMNVHTTNGEAARNMVVCGVGLGLMMQVFVLSVQNAVPREVIGSATAMTQFCRSIGATLGVTIMGVIVNQGLPAGVHGSEGIGIHRLPPRLRAELAGALHPAFLATSVVSALIWFVVLFGIEDVQLRRSVAEHPVVEDLAAGAPDSQASRVAAP